MKKILKILPLVFFLFTINSFAQNTFNEKEVKTSLSALFDLCKTKSYEKAADYLAYTGKDAARIEKDTFNFSDNSEKKSVKRKCKKIKAYLELSDSYEYDGFSSEGNKGTINVNFISGDQKLRISFNFVKVNGKILLVDFK